MARHIRLENSMCSRHAIFPHHRGGGPSSSGRVQGRERSVSSQRPKRGDPVRTRRCLSPSQAPAGSEGGAHGDGLWGRGAAVPNGHGHRQRLVEAAQQVRNLTDGPGQGLTVS